MPISALLATSSGSTFTDYLTGWGTILLAAGTFMAVIVTVRAAGRDRRRGQAEQHARQLAQARLVLTGMPGSDPAERPDPGYHHTLTFTFENYGDRPVLDVQFEAWGGGAALDQPATWGINSRIVQPGPNEPWVMRDIVTNSPNLNLAAWRYRWTDADGRQWCVDQPQQREPMIFTGQPPRRY